MVRIAVGCDHAGYLLKGRVIDFLKSSGYQVADFGTFSQEPVDYPDYCRLVGESILSGDSAMGILICGSGIGASVAANKLPGIRAGLCHDTFSAHQGREDDDMNVLCLGARVIGEELAVEVIKTWLSASFRGKQRHVRRLRKIKEMEERFGTYSGFTQEA